MNGSKNAIVETLNGKLEGTIEDGLYVFKGVPYAVPPVGKLRWLPPEPAKPWKGIRSAHNFGAVAPQNQSSEALVPEWNVKSLRMKIACF